MQASAGLPPRDQVLRDPDLFLHKIDLLREAALFVRLSRAEFRAASFLDDRILKPNMFGLWTPLRNAAVFADASPAKPLHFIFHAGHVGSTLLSRLIETVAEVLSLREPMPLRALAEAQDVLGAAESLISPEHFIGLLRAQIALWGRGYDDTQAVVVKATSATARLAPRLLETHAPARAVCLNLGLQSYLETLLAGENSWMDLRGHAAERQRRLRAMDVDQNTPLHALSMGELAAHAWLAETLTQQRIVAAYGARILPIDFDSMLGDTSGTLRNVCRHFGVAASEDALRAAPQSIVLQRYAKAPDAEYSPSLRARVLQQARVQQGAEIGKGRRWTEDLARRSPAAALVLG